MSLTTPLIPWTTAMANFQTITTPSPTAITTPWVFPTTCTSLLTICSAVRLGLPNPPKTNTHEYFLCMETYAYPWEECQPESSNRPIRTAAVCPSGWWALNVGMRETGKALAATGKETGWRTLDKTTYSTARCCSIGDSLGDDIYHMYNPDPSVGQIITDYPQVCVTTWSDPSAASTRYVTSAIGPWYELRYSTVSILTSGIGYYPGWSIEWQASDTSTLSPAWPPLSNNMVIPTWTEGMYIFPGEFDGDGDLAPSFVPQPLPETAAEKEAHDREVKRMLKIYLPIGIVLFVLLVLAYWRVHVIFRKVRKREEQVRQGTWSPDVLQLESERREGAPEVKLAGASSRLGGRGCWRRGRKAEKAEKNEAVELQELEIPIR